MSPPVAPKVVREAASTHSLTPDQGCKSPKWVGMGTHRPRKQRMPGEDPQAARGGPGPGLVQWAVRGAVSSARCTM